MVRERLNHPIHNINKTFGQTSADAVASFIGSWTFIIIFLIFIMLWISANTFWILFGQKWDSQPFVLLNLVLAAITSIQAPIILMSQNREVQRERLIAEYDYSVNRKSEKEIGEIKKQLERIERKLNERR
ncbi:MAG: DUF1003 domain-containing protein [Nanoarchaeota archaeon]